MDIESNELLVEALASAIKRAGRFDRTRLASMFPDIPRYVMTGYGSPEGAIDWTRNNLPTVLPELLRSVDLADDEALAFAGAGAFGYLNKPPGEQMLQVVAFLEPGRFPPPPVADAVRLDQLAALSAGLLEVFSKCASAMRGFLPPGEEFYALAPPLVQVRSGSIQTALSGSMLLAGAGLVLAAATGGVAPIAGFAIGGTLSALGTVDLALNWWDRITTIGARNEKRAHDDDLARLEKRKRKLELKLLEQQARQNGENSTGVRPASNLLHPDVVRIEAERWGLSQPQALHVANRALPTAAATVSMIGPLHVDGPPRRY